MIRYKQHIRLTPDEKRMFRRDTGRLVVPKSVADYNRAMQAAREDHEASDTPEGRLMAMMMPDIK